MPKTGASRKKRLRQAKKAGKLPAKFIRSGPDAPSAKKNAAGPRAGPSHTIPNNIVTGMLQYVNKNRWILRGFVVQEAILACQTPVFGV